MNIKIIANYTKLTVATEGAIKEYGKRLSRYCKFSFLSLKKEKDIAKHLSPSTSIFMITTSKQTISSEELADTIKTLGLTGHSDVVFFVDFSYETISSFVEETQAITSTSISSLSFSTALTVAVLSEQIYRAYRIMNGEPYHK